ncbi:uncharacterized protein LOC126895597 isoform X2 [Daktulosphaira vitifoliae]|nr:uncharacterized protein LOC126895597 isoform X2 [Daktulosphaira vitifoliae]XP_050523622.1 uncharacterized protein LOC126895597 isoform X2 [Daktulosphaira vitifoliae]
MEFIYIISANNKFNGGDLTNFNDARSAIKECLINQKLSSSFLSDTGHFSEGLIYRNFDYIKLLKMNKITLVDYIQKFVKDICDWYPNDIDCPSKSKICAAKLINYLKVHPECLPFDVNVELFEFPCENDKYENENNNGV